MTELALKLPSVHDSICFRAETLLSKQMNLYLMSMKHICLKKLMQITLAALG